MGPKEMFPPERGFSLPGVATYIHILRINFAFTYVVVNLQAFTGKKHFIILYILYMYPHFQHWPQYQYQQILIVVFYVYSIAEEKKRIYQAWGPQTYKIWWVSTTTAVDYIKTQYMTSSWACEKNKNKKPCWASWINAGSCLWCALKLSYLFT